MAQGKSQIWLRKQAEPTDGLFVVLLIKLFLRTFSALRQRKNRRGEEKSVLVHAGSLASDIAGQELGRAVKLGSWVGEMT